MSEPLFRVRGLTVGYPRRPGVIAGLDAELPAGGLTAIVGPNGCGKSTLLLTLARLLRPAAGSIAFRGRPLTEPGARELARQLAFLPQQPVAPEGIRVRDLVMRGRQPHRRPLLPPTAADADAVDRALAATGCAHLAYAEVASLSGGQRQRVWIAMTLAQQTGTVLLDEPTSFLDIAHQIEVLDACAGLVAGGRSVIAVLHDLSLAARYADWMLLLDSGRLVCAGPPAAVVDADLIEATFGLPCRVVDDPETDTPLVVPRHLPTAPGGLRVPS
ncbi:MAG TPA: ABC transporter ATP-binding protein [Candidatus Nanopelagicales bacterium]|nr:ABC transporter ATP-binding protein [Candidatus Nanopelagicales bacterium]